MRKIEDLPGITEEELIKLGKCLICGRALLEKEIIFYRVSVEMCGFDAQAIKQRVGLEMMLGSGPLARVMGPTDALARVVSGPAKVAIHQSCGDKIMPLFIYHVMERALEPEDEAKNS